MRIENFLYKIILVTAILLLIFSTITIIAGENEFVELSEDVTVESNENMKPENCTPLGTFTATGYISATCGKASTHPSYGITASGFNLIGHSRESAMSIATDPKVIPMGTKVYLEFGEGYEHFNGVYTARDTGGSIKGKKVDVYMGEVSSKEVYDTIGRRNVKVYLINESGK